MWGYAVVAGIGGLLGWALWPKHKLPGPPHPGPINPVDPTISDIVYAQGKAKLQANTLYEFLKLHGYPPPGSTLEKSYHDMVRAFQQVHNSDSNAHKLTLSIPTNGIYDVRTSSALTLYTHDPIPADPSSPLPRIPTKQDIEQATSANPIPAMAGNSGYNLWQYLKTHKNDGSSILKQLTQQFQYDWNNDPMVGPTSPGAKYKSYGKIVLKINGILDSNTLKVLKGMLP